MHKKRLGVIGRRLKYERPKLNSRKNGFCESLRHCFPNLCQRVKARHGLHQVKLLVFLDFSWIVTSDTNEKTQDYANEVLPIALKLKL